MKYYFLIISLLVSLVAKSQIEENTATFNEDIEHYDYYYPNTNIGKSSLVSYGGAGYMPFIGKLMEYSKPSWGGAMSLDYNHHNNMTFSLSIMGTFSSNLRKDVNINNNMWTPLDTVTFWSYGLSVGYSVLNNVHWRINPFGGIVLSHTELVSPSGNKYKSGAKPSPIIGMNISYRFINVNKEKQYSGMSSCFGINARITYIPYAVNNKEIPFSGSIWYMTIGVTLNLYGNN